MQPEARRHGPWPGTARWTRPCLGRHPGPWHGPGTARWCRPARWRPGAPFGPAAHEGQQRQI